MFRKINKLCLYNTPTSHGIRGFTTMKSDKLKLIKDKDESNEMKAKLGNVSTQFYDTLNKEFSGSMLLNDFIYSSYIKLTNEYKFTYDNTMGIASLCRDEIATPLLEKIVKTYILYI